MQGIDVSHYQGNINWSQVKQAGIDFAFIKATEGIGYIDPKFQQNWLAAQQAGIQTGAYHFFRPTEDPQLQAKNFIASIKAADYKQTNLPLVLDVEIAGGVSAQDLQQNIGDLLAAIQQALQTTPMIYTDPSFWNTSIGIALNEYPLWIADWTQRPAPTLPNGWSDWEYWQYSQSGTVAGITGPVDLNRTK